jgi:hypothetical protein
MTRFLVPIFHLLDFHLLEPFALRRRPWESLGRPILPTDTVEVKSGAAHFEIAATVRPGGLADRCRRRRRPVPSKGKKWREVEPMSLAQPRSSLACIAGIAVLLGAACANPIKTAHDSDPDADFTRYQSYAWIKDGPLIGAGEVRSSYVSPIDEQRIRAAVEAELAAKGYSKAASPEEADLVVSYAIGTEEKTRVRQDPGRSSVYYAGYGYGYWYGGSTVSVQQYTEGTLTIEFWDRRSKQAVWVGWASKRLSKSDDSHETIGQAVAMTLEPFPARAP